jgi:hypothetical protein
MPKSHGFEPVFGIPTAFSNPSGTQILDISIEESFAQDSNVKDKDGIIIHERMDDRRKALNVTLLETSAGFTQPNAGGSFAIGGVTYKVTNISNPESNTDFVRHTIQGENLEGITTYVS